MKPLFIPLKTEFFRAFQNGTKRTEYRRYGKIWNERSCKIGRQVILSHGYGKHERLSGRVVGFAIAEMDSREWLACYGTAGTAACIEIVID